MYMVDGTIEIKQIKATYVETTGMREFMKHLFEFICFVGTVNGTD